MKQSRENRIEHYCNKLGLNRWDIKDIHEFFRYAAILQKEQDKGNYTYYGFRDEKEKYDKYSYRIHAAGLYEIKQRFAEYLGLEKKLYNRYKSNNPDLNDNDIWLKIYQEIDFGIEEDIYNAKEIAKEIKKNNGCTPILMFTLIFSLASYFIVFKAFS